MGSPTAKKPGLPSSARGNDRISTSTTKWLSLAALACVALYISAYVLDGQRLMGQGGNAPLVAPRHRIRGQLRGGVTAAEAKVKQRGEQISAPKATRSVTPGVKKVKGEEEKGEEEMEVEEMEEEEDADYSYEDERRKTLRLRTSQTMDDERYRENRELDVKLNPLVTSKVTMRTGWVDTPGDARLAEQLEENSTFVLHQTWKTDCVLQSRVDYMKTWLEVEPDVQVLFWTDDTMESWVEERFAGTPVHEAWGVLEHTQQAKIKKADMFRALVMWFYGGVYADLDIEMKAPVRGFIENEETVIVWEPESAMAETNAVPLGGVYEKRRGARKTLMLSAFAVSGRRYADFFGYYINWIVANTLSGRSGQYTHVLDHTGPIAEAEAYYYYTGRLAEHDALLKVLSFEEFQNYGEHHTVPGDSTWEEGKDAGACADVRDVYGSRVEFPR
jgi:hypothetical protein